MDVVAERKEGEHATAGVTSQKVNHKV